jgi:copper/silver efflux system protein
MGARRPPRTRRRVIVAAVQEVGPASFFSLLVIAVSFLPILALEAQEGRLFKPLAYTKNLAMIVAAFLAITLDPALRLMFTSTTHLRPASHAAKQEHPVSRLC